MIIILWINLQIISNCHGPLITNRKSYLSSYLDDDLIWTILHWLYLYKF